MSSDNSIDMKYTYEAAPSFNNLSLFNKTLTSTIFKHNIQCIRKVLFLPLNTSLNSPGGAFFMKLDTICTYHYKTQQYLQFLFKNDVLMSV